MRPIALSIAALTLCLATLSLGGTPRAERNLKAFPPAEEGMSRYVIMLDELEDESLVRVELIVGKTIMTDGVNRYAFGGKIEAQTVAGWGFTRYTVKELSGPISTRMAALGNVEPVKKFVTIGAEPYLVRYNSKLPIVVYVPDGAEVRYRLWQAKEQVNAAARG